MSRKHAHRAENRPASRRYVQSVVQRARDDVLSAIVNASDAKAVVSGAIEWPTAIEWSTEPRFFSAVEPRMVVSEEEKARTATRLARYVG